MKKRYVVLLLIVLIAIYGVFVEPARLTVRHERLDLPQWPAALSGFRVVLISDVHAGAPFMTENKVREIVRLANAADADLILLLGDYVTTGVLGGRRVPPETLTPLLAPLHSRHGTFAVL